MSVLQAFASELEQEAAATRRMLERVPEERFDFRPHPRSMSLGQLALHIARTPGAIAEILPQESVPPPDFEDLPMPASREEILATFDAGVEKARAVLAEMDDATAFGTWRMLRDGEELMAMPRIALARAILLNHLYHHRGQLSVYLRLLDVPLPSIYGPTADESPFAP